MLVVGGRDVARRGKMHSSLVSIQFWEAPKVERNEGRKGSPGTEDGD